MVSLVPEYSSSSSSGTDDDEEIDSKETHLPPSNISSQTLINPFRATSDTLLQEEYPFFSSTLSTNNSLPPVSISAFSNPYQEAENAKHSVLEKHVKMTPNSTTQKSINGRQVCWNYRKGSCRFGHNCKFAHDSDLVNSQISDENVNSPSLPVLNTQTTVIKKLDTGKKRKKRPGLCQGITPTKRVMKEFYKQRKQQTGLTTK